VGKACATLLQQLVQLSSFPLGLTLVMTISNDGAYLLQLACVVQDQSLCHRRAAEDVQEHLTTSWVSRILAARNSKRRSKKSHLHGQDINTCDCYYHLVMFPSHTKQTLALLFAGVLKVCVRFGCIDG
jgi:hypothetical protein